MIAAVYCRKSTTQKGRDGKPLDDDADDKSVKRQEDDARKFCADQGWTVAEVYIDDKVSGAEVMKLAAKQRMLDDIRSGRATFQVLVMQSNDRLSRRDGDEAFAEMKAIARTGIDVWFYSTRRQFDYGTFESNTLGFLNAEFAAQFRREVARKTREAMVRKFHLGHVTGGIVYGYDNVKLNSHTERRVNEAEAAIVQRIYEHYAAGAGLGTIAHELNARNAPRPKPRKNQPPDTAWSPSSVREILKRPLYRGLDVYGRAKKRDKEGHVRASRQPAEAWMRREVPELRIVPADVVAAVDARFADMRERTLRQSNGRLIGRPPGEGSPYLLVGLLSCGVCGGSMEVLSSCNSKTGGRRVFHYRCYNARRKGPAVCTNTQPAKMGDADAAVLRAVESTLLHADVVAKAITYAEATLTADATKEERAQVEKGLAESEAVIARLTSAIANGGDLQSLVASLAAQEQRKTELQGRLVKLVRSRAPIDRVALRRELRAYIADWKTLLAGHVHQAQQILRRLIVDRLVFTPRAGGYYSFAGAGTVRPLVAGVIRCLASPASSVAEYPDQAGAIRCLASPTGFEPVFQP